MVSKARIKNRPGGHPSLLVSDLILRFMLPRVKRGLILYMKDALSPPCQVVSKCAFQFDKLEFVSIPYKSFPCFIWNSFSFYYNSRIAGISSPGLSLKY